MKGETGASDEVDGRAGYTESGGEEDWKVRVLPFMSVKEVGF